MAKKFIPEGELHKIDHEWRELKFYDPSDVPSSSGTRKNVVSFWGGVGQITNTSGESRFPTISKLTKSLLSLPHSNAEVERVLSQVVLLTTKVRKKLKSSTLDSLLMTKRSLPCSCVDFKPESSMRYKRMKSSTLYDSESTDSD